MLSFNKNTLPSVPYQLLTTIWYQLRPTKKCRSSNTWTFNAWAKGRWAKMATDNTVIFDHTIICLHDHMTSWSYDEVPPWLLGVSPPRYDARSRTSLARVHGNADHACIVLTSPCDLGTSIKITVPSAPYSRWHSSDDTMIQFKIISRWYKILEPPNTRAKKGLEPKWLRTIQQYGNVFLSPHTAIQ